LRRQKNELAMAQVAGRCDGCFQEFDKQCGVFMRFTNYLIIRRGTMNAEFNHDTQNFEHGAASAAPKTGLDAWGMQIGAPGSNAPGSQSASASSTPPPSTDSGAQRDLLAGGVICLIGILVTAMTYNMASSGGGGHYVIAWGAILFGGIRFLKGLARLA
jgi:hypothetical protein